MKWKTRPDRPPEDPVRPASVLCRTQAERDAVMARADKLAKVDGKWVEKERGDYFVRAWEVVRNGVYRMHLELHGDPEPKNSLTGGPH